MTGPVFSDDRLPLEALPEQYRRNVDPASPLPLRRMTAQGLVPMGEPANLVTALFMLQTDADPEVAQTSRATLDELPPDVVKPALAARIDVRVLDHFAERYLRVPEYVDAIIINAATADETIHFLAQKAKERQLELIAANQVRMLRFPAIVEALYFNPQTRMSTVDRVVEFAARAGVYLDGIPAFKEVCDALGVPVPVPGGAPEIPLGLEAVEPEPFEVLPEEEPDASDSSFATFLDESLAVEVAKDDLSTLEAAFGGVQKESTEEAEEKVKRGRNAEIGAMTVSQKVRLALLGTKEDRTILVRDRTRLVSMAVIKSPKIQVMEAAKYAGMRNIDDAIIDYIAGRRQWLKNYSVKRALVTNPATPVGTALKLLVYLRKPDLRQVATAKGVSHVVAAAAKQRLKNSM